MPQLLLIPFHISAFSFPLKAGLSIGLLGVSAVTAGVSTWQNKMVASDSKLTEALKPFTSVFTETIPKFFKEEIGKGGNSIFKAYGSWEQELSQEVLSTSNPLLTTLNTWSNSVKGGVENFKNGLSKNLSLIETINYYVFELGSIVQKLLPYINEILIDSIKETASPDSDSLLGVQKIEGIVSDSNSSSLWSSIKEMFLSLQDTISNFTNKQIGEIIEYLRSVKKSEISKFVEETKKNAEKIKNDASSYEGDPEKILTDLLIGEEGMKQAKEGIEKLIGALDKKQTAVKKLLGAKSDMFDTLKTSLNNLKDKFEAKP
ncbi:hypothetical protein [Candidatus Mycoplasma haematohominis]|uniref:hypothetical protein n=1 Tax=Candidatus Mycoplasma haematohominis TaxID=1494318 RepID=UPI001C0A6E0F|nr:hypothetical protein [Candidatus Mycoplasma haemohominis]